MLMFHETVLNLCWRFIYNSLCDFNVSTQATIRHGIK